MQEKVNEILNHPFSKQSLYFNEMLTPKIIRIAYWALLVLIIVTGLDRLFSGGLGNFLGGVAQIVAGLIMARIAAEIVMVLFKINENLDTLVERDNPTVSATAEDPQQ